MKSAPRRRSPSGFTRNFLTPHEPLPSMATPKAVTFELYQNNEQKHSRDIPTNHRIPIGMASLPQDESCAHNPSREDQDSNHTDQSENPSFAQGISERIDNAQSDMNKQAPDEIGENSSNHGLQQHESSSTMTENDSPVKPLGASDGNQSNSPQEEYSHMSTTDCVGSSQSNDSFTTSSPARPPNSSTATSPEQLKLPPSARKLDPRPHKRITSQSSPGVSATKSVTPTWKFVPSRPTTHAQSLQRQQTNTRLRSTKSPSLASPTVVSSASDTSISNNNNDNHNHESSNNNNVASPPPAKPDSLPKTMPLASLESLFGQLLVDEEGTLLDTTGLAVGHLNFKPSFAAARGVHNATTSTATGPNRGGPSSPRGRGNSVRGNVRGGAASAAGRRPHPARAAVAAAKEKGKDRTREREHEMDREPVYIEPPKIDNPRIHDDDTTGFAAGASDERPSWIQGPQQVYLDVKSTNDGIHFIVKLPTNFGACHHHPPSQY